MAERLIQVDTDLGDDITVPPFFKTDQEKPRMFSAILGCLLHFMVEAVPMVGPLFNPRTMKNPSCPLSIINIAAPFLPLAGDKVPDILQESFRFEDEDFGALKFRRLISPYWLAHISFLVLHSVSPSRKTSLRHILTKTPQVKSIRNEIEQFNITVHFVAVFLQKDDENGSGTCRPKSPKAQISPARPGIRYCCLHCVGNLPY